MHLWALFFHNRGLHPGESLPLEAVPHLWGGGGGGNSPQRSSLNKDIRVAQKTPLTDKMTQAYTFTSLMGWFCIIHDTLNYTLKPGIFWYFNPNKELLQETIKVVDINCVGAEIFFFFFFFAEKNLVVYWHWFHVNKILSNTVFPYKVGFKLISDIKDIV